MSISIPLPGDVVAIRQQRWRVDHARRVLDVIRLDVSSHERRMTFLAPFDRLETVGRPEKLRCVRPRQAVARLAALIGSAIGHRDVMSALGAGVDILPYQLEPVLALLDGQRRVLLTDEVGLGKTIQAGLAVGEIIRREPGARVLVLVPASIRGQWMDELAGRLGVPAMAADQQRLDQLAATRAFGANPWNRAGVWITSVDFVKQRHVLLSLPRQPWDLLVIDEAHDACGQSARHEACQHIARRSRRVLLVTATPHSGDSLRFGRLTGLGRLDGADDPLTIFSRTRTGLGLPAARRVRWHRVRLTSSERRLLEALAGFERSVLSRGPEHGAGALLLLSVFRKRALSTSRALRRSLARRLAWLDAREPDDDAEWQQPLLEFDEDVLASGEAAGLEADSGLAPRHERAWLRRLCTLADAAARDESKVRRLRRLVTRSAEPLIVFTEFRDSLEAAVRATERVRPVAMLHGGMAPAERRRELGRFESGQAATLVATDVASQGLNLQRRARWIVSLELPWNPVRLEQRAGRVDRIGQRRPVHVSLLVAKHGFEDGLLARLARRVMTARLALGDDTLRLAMPDEASIRVGVLTGVPPECSEPNIAGKPVRISRRWARPARSAGRSLLVRRALACRWRGPGHARIGAVTSGWTRLPHLRAEAGSVLFVFLVPIHDGLGAIVEERVVAVGRASALLSGPSRSSAVEAACAQAAAAVRGRTRRLASLVARQVARAAGVEAALREQHAGPGSPGVFQAGLFDGREVRAAREAAADETPAGEERLTWLRRRQELSVGRPVLVIVFGGTA